MDLEYDKFFGFTQQEVHDMLKYYNVLDKEEELKELQEKENFWLDAKNKDTKQEPQPLISPDMQVVIQ